ncbi:MAG: RagB/SusD family nutrient uptake outer membrane protein [Prevotella sp.]|nr:RagB/SusD family nutrient uptake outer membrane protein [Prevotella sp.]MBQ6682406.1 RagB/SusD family nutrient uptake outer membrane protein [Prevotella sp.]MBR0269491.1 RagB/SusD family nutrient uptake outer membrane protein [Prevotella sp.]
MKANHFISALSAALLFCLLTTMFASCADELDKAPTASISDATFWTDENDAKLALVGCYRFQTSWSHDNFDSPQGLLYLDFAGGNGTEKENFTTLMASSNTTATNTNIYWYWANAYTQIAKYNTFLDNIGNCKMDETKKQVWSAEVKCLRAYFFYNLAFYFKDVPMPLTTLNVDEANSIEQTPQVQVYAQVEGDLKEAISLLPTTQTGDDFGRFTRGAAQALLGRVYLAQNKYSEATDIYRQIISSNTYKLDRQNGTDSYEKLFYKGGEYSPETIFCIMGIKDKFTNSRYIYLFPEAMGGWHQFAPYNELVKAYFCTDGKSIEESLVYNENDPYVNRDPRLYATIYLPPLGSYPGTTFNGITYDCYNGANTADSYNRFTLFNGYCPKKGADPDNCGNIWDNYVYTPIIRYAEVLLSYLEALNESQPSAVTQGVLDQTINDIRTRVQLPAIQKEDVSSQELVRQAVRKERRVELAFEGLRYFDVLRWGIAAQELNHTFTGVKLSDDPSARNYRGSGSSASPVDKDGYYQFEPRSWSSHNRYWPIPQNDLNINKNLKQNEGYN